MRFAPEQIIGTLRETELFLGQDMNIGEAIRKLGVSEQTYYRWRKEYGGMTREKFFHPGPVRTPNGR